VDIRNSSGHPHYPGGILKNKMAWETYHKEIIKAKEEYDRTLKPIIEILEHTQKEAWNKYVIKITQAECFLRDDLP
jgi:hypothetical protein